MSDWDNSKDTGNGPEDTKSNKSSAGEAPAGPPRNEEAREAARERGWVEPQPFDYTALGKSTVVEGEEGIVNVEEGHWAHAAAKYEWDEAFGDVGPENEDLEQQLFRSENINRQGSRFDHLLQIKVIAEAEERPAPISDFHAAGLHPVMVNNIDLCGYNDPTPIQAYTIPAVLQNRDVIATAQTGSGKTAAYLIPCLSKLMGKAKKLAAPRPNLTKGFNLENDSVRAEPLVLIVAPTRELCCQIFDEVRRLCYRSMLRPCVVYGGAPVREQKIELARGCDILVAAPGRLMDFMSQPHILSLARVRYTIIDEADELLHGDWEPEMEKIMSGGDMNEDGDHRYLLFSATFDREMRKVAKKFLSNDHIRIRIGRSGSSHGNVKQTIVWVENSMKKQALYDLLMSMPPSRTLIFVKSKKTVDFVDDYLFNLGLPTTSIHSDRTQREREDAIRAFKTGRAPIMIATGVSGRGLDIRNVMHVINYDCPDIEYNGKEEYIHRIGRTARIGNEGLATTFVNDRDEPMFDYLAKILLESEQDLPDFWEDRKPEDGEKIDFDDNSDAEDNANDEAGENGDGGAAVAQEEAW